MPYHRGDYVGRGESGYVRGDPFLGAALGFVAKKVAAPLVKKAGAWIGRQTVGGLAAKTAGTIATGTILTKAASQGGVTISPADIMPGGDPFLTFGSGRRRYRKMNPLNPKALRRALRRAEGFEKFARKTMSALYKPGSSRKFKKSTRKG